MDLLHIRYDGLEVTRARDGGTDHTLLSAGHALVVAHALATDDVGSIAFPIATQGAVSIWRPCFRWVFRRCSWSASPRQKACRS